MTKAKDAEIRVKVLQEAITNLLSSSEVRELVKTQQLPVQGKEWQTRIEAITKKINKLQAWDNADKHSKIKPLLQ
ncbi:hypothetical protein [Microcoleus sp. B7-D4]|uniref:hypothetical protein n=1 Tax=Microcoleus sp. B7-D4 TaxID=2818696 RepID=UPI002FD301F7